MHFHFFVPVIQGISYAFSQLVGKGRPLRRAVRTPGTIKPRTTNLNRKQLNKKRLTSSGVRNRQKTRDLFRNITGFLRSQIFNFFSVRLLFVIRLLSAYKVKEASREVSVHHQLSCTLNRKRCSRDSLRGLYRP